MQRSLRTKCTAVFIERETASRHAYHLLYIFKSESTAKYIESRQALTTIPFRWDEASDEKSIKTVLVNSYNAVSTI